MNTAEQESLWYDGTCFGSMLGLEVDQSLIFRENTILIFKEALRFCTPTKKE